MPTIYMFGVVAVWLIVAYRLMKFAEASGVENGSFAFIPILNFIVFSASRGQTRGGRRRSSFRHF